MTSRCDLGAEMPKKNSPMSSDHKKALAEGRELGKSVRQYLEALDENKPKRGRKRTADSIKKRLDTIETSVAEASVTKRLEMLQERRDLTVELATMGTKVDLSALESDFVKVAKSYGERKGITYATWREFGVSAETLKQAGISRGV